MPSSNIEMDIELLRSLFRYNPDTGDFYWSQDMPLEAYSSKKAWNVARARCAGKPAGWISDQGYREITFRKKKMKVHRVVWAMHYGKWPTHHVDHINGERADNRICNLRDVTRAENLRNVSRRSDNTTGVTGVIAAPTKGRFTASIGLGSFGCITAAMIARKKAEKLLGFHENHGRA